MYIVKCAKNDKLFHYVCSLYESLHNVSLYFILCIEYRYTIII